MTSTSEELSTAQIRSSAAEWSLWCDVLLRRSLEQFAAGLHSNLNQVQTMLENLDAKIDRSALHLANVSNQFALLSNVQFVENRVQEEDDEVVEQHPHSHQTLDSEATAQSAEQLFYQKACHVLQESVAFIDQAFEQVQFEPSDSEDEDLVNDLEPIFEHRNVYQFRRLPYIIGSAKFLSDETLGLVDSSPDEEEERLHLTSESSEEGDGASGDESSHVILDDHQAAELPSAHSSTSDWSRPDTEVQSESKEKTGGLVALSSTEDVPKKDPLDMDSEEGALFKTDNDGFPVSKTSFIDELSARIQKSSNRVPNAPLPLAGASTTDDQSAEPSPASSLLQANASTAPSRDQIRPIVSQGKSNIFSDSDSDDDLFRPDAVSPVKMIGRIGVRSEKEEGQKKVLEAASLPVKKITSQRLFDSDSDDPGDDLFSAGSKLPSAAVMGNEASRALGLQTSSVALPNPEARLKPSLFASDSSGDDDDDDAGKLTTSSRTGPGTGNETLDADPASTVNKPLSQTAPKSTKVDSLFSDSDSDDLFELDKKSVMVKTGTKLPGRTRSSTAEEMFSSEDESLFTFAVQEKSNRNPPSPTGQQDQRPSPADLSRKLDPDHEQGEDLGHINSSEQRKKEFHSLLEATLSKKQPASKSADNPKQGSGLQDQESERCDADGMDESRRVLPSLTKCRAKLPAKRRSPTKKAFPSYPHANETEKLAADLGGPMSRAQAAGLSTLSEDSDSDLFASHRLTVAADSSDDDLFGTASSGNESAPVAGLRPSGQNPLFSDDDDDDDDHM